MKIIIISGTIHPHISPRSFRTTELAVGLAKKGHEVTLYSILGDSDYTDFKQGNNIKVKNLGKSYFGNINSDGKYTNRNLLNRIIGRLLYNVIDYPRVEYFFKAIKSLRKESKFDYLITIAHPFGIHWGTAFYKKYINKSLFNVWTSDCGDPFMGDPDVKRRKLFLKPIEKFWCNQTDFIAIPVEEGRSGYYKEFHNKIYIIPQGIDFSKIELQEYIPNIIPTFLYAGAIYPGMRDPSLFLDYLCTLRMEFKFIIYTPFLSSLSKYIDKLGNKLEIRSYIPRKDLIKIMSTMDFLINLKNDSEVQQPSKLIDYSLSKRPILDISTSFTENENIAFDEFLIGKYTKETVVENFSQFDISNVCEQFLELYKLKCKTK